MKYIFVINSRADKRETIDKDLERQLSGKDIHYDVYHTEGSGDGIRFVRIYCDLHQEEEVCFVACGGSGTLNEVASGIVGFHHKSLAFLAYGSTNDFTKNYPDRDFHSLDRILNGENTLIDIIKVNDNYSINVANIGFDSEAAFWGGKLAENGMDGVKAYRRAVFSCILTKRFNRIQVTADGEKLNNKRMLLCTFGNGRWYGGQYLCSPNAVLDDGLIEVCLFKACSLITFLRLLKHYEKGDHLVDPFCKKRLVYRRARHVTATSRNLIYACLDGETIAAGSYEVDILHKAINLVLPQKEEKK